MRDFFHTGLNVSRSDLERMKSIFTGAEFHVDGTHGSDGNDGLTKDTPFATPQKACDASAAAQVLNPNSYLRNRIYITPRGGSTVGYAPITSICNYTDFIGVGAPPFGDGTGIVVLAGTSSVDAITGSFRGNRFYNIQFSAYDGQNCFYAPSLILRSGWYGCAFMGRVDETTPPNAAILCDGPFAGNEIIHCKVITNESLFLTGFSFAVANNGALNNNTIDDCLILATTVGLVTGSVGWDMGSIIKNCHVGGRSADVCAKGIDINSEYGDWVVCNNTVVATDAIEYTNNANKSVFNNKVINGTTPVTEPTLHGSA